MATQIAFPPRPASQKQLDFIAKLRSERAPTPFTERQLTYALSTGMTSKAASGFIDNLLKADKRAPVIAGPVGNHDVRAALLDVELSKYAVPANLLMIPGLDIKGDLLFLEVRRYKETVYMRRLHGAPGQFQRTRLTASQTIALAAVIRNKHVEYARLFGEHYACCGRCGAELTDQKSREVFLGPECRKVFGV